MNRHGKNGGKRIYVISVHARPELDASYELKKHQKLLNQRKGQLLCILIRFYFTTNFLLATSQLSQSMEEKQTYYLLVCVRVAV